jgi:hypothetical protein
LAAAGVVLLDSLLWGLLKCDEACDGRGWRKWPLAALAAFAAGALTTAATLESFSPGWDDDIGEHPTAVGIVAAVAVAAVLAALLAAPAARDRTG